MPKSAGAMVFLAVLGRSGSTSQSPVSFVEHCQEALETLDRALQLPPLRLGTEVDMAENLVVQLRDALIQRLRNDATTSASPRLREALSRTNSALSLIVGIEYPAASIQHAAIEQARDALAHPFADGLLVQD